jgi:VIT1/CCC1 family predicted Fe2+/Mn2+ transporter
LQRRTIKENAARYVLQKVQPALLGLMDGSVSTLAPLFAAAGLTNQSHKAFLVGLAAAIGAGISMGLAEALSDDGAVTGRGNPVYRGMITGFATAIGGMLHTLPFLIGIRYKFMRSSFWSTVLQVIFGGGIVFLLGIWLGRLGLTG